MGDDYVPVEPPAVIPLNDYGGADTLKSWINVSNSIPSVGFVASPEEEPESFDDPYIVSHTGISLEGFSPTDATGFIPVGLLEGYYGDSLAELTSINLVSVLNPDEYHETDVDHTLSVVVADLAGNLTTQTLDFNIDTRLADGPDVLVERTISATPALDLDYWETIETFNGVEGVRIQFTEIGDDQVAPSSVMVNGVLAQVVDASAGIFFAARSGLVDSETGLKAIGFTDFEVDGITTSRPIFSLTDVDHGVSLAGNYILVGNTAGELQAHAVTGNGSLESPFQVAALADEGVLVDGLLAGTNVVEFDVIDAHGNVNSFVEFFTSDLEQPDGQYFSVVPTLFTENLGADTVMRLDVYASDFALSEFGSGSDYGGTSFDMIMELPDTIFNDGAYSFSANEGLHRFEAVYESQDNTVRFGAFSDGVFLGQDDPLLTIDFLIEDPDSIEGESGLVTVTVAKISEAPIYAEDDLLSFQYTINVDDLIITPIELSV